MAILSEGGKVDRMVLRKTGFSFIPLVIFFGVSVIFAAMTAGGFDDVEALYSNREKFPAVTPGMSIAGVKNLVGGMPRHGFTVTKDGSIYTFVSYDFDNGVNLSILYRDGLLQKIIQPRACKQFYEKVPYRGTTATRRLPWTIDQAYSVIAAAVLDTPPLAPTVIQEKLAHENKDDGPFNSLIFKGLFGLMSPGMKRDYAENLRLIATYDGLRIQPGMTMDQVEDCFGKPLHRIRKSDSETVGIYGETIDLDINPLLSYSCVAVLFRDGCAARVFSRHLFCKDWIDGKHIVAEE